MDVADDVALVAWLEGGGSIDASGDGGLTVLMGAAASGNVKLVTQLLDRGCDVNQQEGTSGRTALMAACSGGLLGGDPDRSGTPQPQVARLLLQRGARADLRSSSGKNVLEELAEATRSRVLGPLEFTRTMECTKVVAAHLEELEERSHVRIPEVVEGLLTTDDEQAFEAWARRVEHEQAALMRLCEENRRRGMDHVGRLTSIVSEASGRNLLDRTRDAAGALKRNRMRAIEREKRGGVVKWSPTASSTSTHS